MKINKVDALNGVEKFYKEKDNPDSAIWYAKKVLNEKITNTYPAGKLKAVNLLADIYESQKNTDSSLHFYQKLLGLVRKGDSWNNGTEQAHLNFVEGASLHITGLRAAAGRTGRQMDKRSRRLGNLGTTTYVPGSHPSSPQHP